MMKKQSIGIIGALGVCIPLFAFGGGELWGEDKSISKKQNICFHKIELCINKGIPGIFCKDKHLMCYVDPKHYKDKNIIGQRAAPKYCSKHSPTGCTCGPNDP